MLYSEFYPTEILRPYIKGYRIIENQIEEHRNTLLPDTSLAMAFVFKGKVNQFVNNENLNISCSVLTGFRKSPRKVSYDFYTSNLVVLFNTVGVSAFIKQPLHEIYNQTISLYNLFHKLEIEQLEEQLRVADSNEERIRLMDNFFMNQLRPAESPALILEAVKRIDSAQGNIKITELIKSLYISQDAFEKRFRKVVGTTPKHYSAIARMKSILKKGEGSLNLLDKAFNLGYYDQSHFIKDFKIFTGKTPSEYYR